jgi:hypothetical protein
MEVIWLAVCEENGSARFLKIKLCDEGYNSVHLGVKTTPNSSCEKRLETSWH